MVTRSGASLPLLLLATLATAEWQVETVEKRKVLDVTFESSKDYDITSAYAVRGWNTTEGKMRMIAPSAVAKHGGRFGLEVRIEKAYTKNFHAQFSLPHFMPRTAHSAYQLTYWAKQIGSGGMTPEVSILDVDEGYDWVGGAEIELGTEWQHIAMEPVYTNENQRGHELQIAFMIGATEGTVCFDPNPSPSPSPHPNPNLNPNPNPNPNPGPGPGPNPSPGPNPDQVCFDDIQLYELDVPSPPPPAPPPPPSFLLWLDGESGPGGVQKIVREGVEGGITACAKCPFKWQRPFGSAPARRLPAPPQGAPGGSGPLGSPPRGVEGPAGPLGAQPLPRLLERAASKGRPTPHPCAVRAGMTADLVS